MTTPTLTLSAPIDGNYICVATLTYEVQRTGSGSDWGSASSVYIIMTQNSVNTVSDSKPYTSTRLPYAIQYAFSPVAGFSIKLAVGCATGAPGTGATMWNIKLQGELVKR